LEVSETPAAPPEDFNLQTYADSSFGIFQGDVEDVVLRVLRGAADDAVGWRFHPTQTVEPQPDGSVIVKFRASGMRELAWHLFTWGDNVEIVAPAVLRETMIEELERSLARHRVG
jgi:predicted DNA-binding transcriptional regulator YafY